MMERTESNINHFELEKFYKNQVKLQKNWSPFTEVEQMSGIPTEERENYFDFFYGPNGKDVYEKYA